MIVTVYQRRLLFQLLFAELSLELFADSLESGNAFVLVVVSGSGDGVCLLIAGIVYGLAQLLVVHLVAVFALHGRAYLFGKLHLRLTLHLDSLVGSLHGVQQVELGHLVHFALHHHDVLVRGSYHKVHIRFFQLLEGRVDDELSVDARYAYLRYRSVEGNV